LAPESPAATAIPAGLSSAEARRRLDAVGPNAVVEAATPAWRIFLAKFWAPVPWLLEAAIVLQIGLGEPVEAAVIAGLLLLNAVLGFVQEGRANAALGALKQRRAPTAAAELVPGDTVRLSLGTVVPADARIVSGSVLIDQSMLTGESVPVDLDAGGSVYAGALVRRGQAVAEVTATGPRTYFGRTAELVRVAHATTTEQAAVLGAVRSLALINGAIAIALVVYAHFLALPGAELLRLALTALLASIPVALPATFTLSAALSAQRLARDGILLTRLSGVHEAAAMDLLCSDKTGTLTRNALEVGEVAPMPGFTRERVLTLAALASSDVDVDPIDATIRRAAAAAADGGPAERIVRFVPFDPATRTSEALVADPAGHEQRIVKGAFHAIAEAAAVPAEARSTLDALAARGHRVIAVATGPVGALRLAGFVALGDPPREDSAGLIAALRDLGVRTVMVTGDSPVTAAAIARQVGITGPVCPAERLAEERATDRFDVFARVVPEDKYHLVKALQDHGHVVGMCGDGANDAPALRQAQIGIAVSTATDVAKAAAGMVLTAPGLAGIVSAVREGRMAFQRLLTYTLNMLVKKIELVVFLAIGLGLTGRPVMTPVLMVLLLVTNDFLSMSLTTDRARPAPEPSLWRMGSITAAAVVLGLAKLAFSTVLLTAGVVGVGLGPGEVQTLAFVAVAFGNQAVMYALRERQRLWHSTPSVWVVVSSALDIGIVTAVALSGVLSDPLPARLVLLVLAAATGFALILDQIKRPVLAAFKVADGPRPSG
jgi:H+-transporting ATPase